MDEMPTIPTHYYLFSLGSLLTNTVVVVVVAAAAATAIILYTRKLCYRKDDRAMSPIHGRPENFRDSLTTPTAIAVGVVRESRTTMILWL